MKSAQRSKTIKGGRVADSRNRFDAWQRPPLYTQSQIERRRLLDLLALLTEKHPKPRPEPVRIQIKALREKLKQNPK